MTVAQFETLPEEEAAAVIGRRFSQLANCGYSLEQAIALAVHLDIDLHRATGLVEGGCPPELAVQILL